MPNPPALNFGPFDLTRQLTRYEMEHFDEFMKYWERTDKPNITWTVNPPRQKRAKDISLKEAVDDTIANIDQYLED